MSATKSHIWSFDLGTGSIGLAVRAVGPGENGSGPDPSQDFIEVKSLLIPSEFGSTKEAAIRRRMHRTRAAHQAREKWLRTCFAECGLNEAILEGRRPVRVNRPDGSKGWSMNKGDYRLEREFPPREGQATQDGAPSDATGANLCYCGPLLRVKLLQNEPLLPWQIFKALHNAIQKRGYDADLPWKNQCARSSENVQPQNKKNSKEIKDAEVSIVTTEKELKELFPNQPEYHYPCYYETVKMGLIDRSNPRDTSKLRIDHQAEPAKGVTFSRKLVEAELRALLEAASKQLEPLKGKTDYILYGPAQQAYASYSADGCKSYLEAKQKRLIRGKATDWQGLLAQKVPTFDNRALSYCALIPRFHTAKAGLRLRKSSAGPQVLDEDSLLPAEVTFLMKLKNFRFSRAGGAEGRFSHELISEIFRAQRNQVTDEQNIELFRLTKEDPEKQLKKWIERADGNDFLANQTEIDAPKSSGRSRYSKPALKIIKKLILSGQPPHIIKEQELEKIGSNRDPLKGLVPDDLKFLDLFKKDQQSGEMRPVTWDEFYLKDESLSYLDHLGDTPAEKIGALIGRQKDPIVRHRLQTFWQLLSKLEKDYGEPAHIVLEFVREDFMGEKAKNKLKAFQKERREKRNQAKEEGAVGKDILRYQLQADQGAQCLYCGSPLGLDFTQAQIEHIVPEASGGPSAYWNLVVACHKCNQEKKDRTPWQWFHQCTEKQSVWDAYVERVRKLAKQLGTKKVRLLTDENAPDLVERYQSLAESAWIAKLAQTIICLHFGWDRHFTGGKRKVVVVPGGLTAHMRRKYKLNSLLRNISSESVQTAEKSNMSEEDFEEKCRGDDRHHALDAMVISFLPQWSVDPHKRYRLKFPPGVNRDFFKRNLSKVAPRFLCVEKSTLEQTFYGRRTMIVDENNKTAEGPKQVATLKRKFEEFLATGDSKKVFESNNLEGKINNILDPDIRADLRNFIESKLKSLDENSRQQKWKEYIKDYKHPKGKKSSPRVKAVRLKVSNSLNEYKDLSKGNKRPALVRGARHKGYYVVYYGATNETEIKPVYSWQSKFEVERELQASCKASDDKVIIGFFYSGCQVRLKNEFVQGENKLAPGLYTLNTIITVDKRAKLTSINGQKFRGLNLANLIKNADFQRA